MNNFIVRNFLALFKTKLARHGAAYVASFLAVHHLASNGEHTVAAILASVLTTGIIVLASMFWKGQPGDDTKEKIGDLVGAIISNGLPAVLAWLNARGVTITGDMSLEQVILLGLNYLESALNKPDATKTDAPKLNINGVKLLLFVCISTLAFITLVRHTIALKNLMVTTMCNTLCACTMSLPHGGTLSLTPTDARQLVTDAQQRSIFAHVPAVELKASWAW